MNDEYLKHAGRLAQLEQEIRIAELKIWALVTSIRNCLDPFAEIVDLKTDMAAQQTMELADARIRWNETCHKIEALKKALGR